LRNSIRHISRPTVFLLLALCLLPAGGHPVADGQELNHDSFFLYSAPWHAGATACTVEPSQRTSHEFLEREHVVALSLGKFTVEFVRAAAFLSKEPVRRLAPRVACRSIPPRAPPSSSIEL
jgi:hypothetical protein